MTIVAAVAVYVVDLSGFTDSWRAALARWLKIGEGQLRPLPPFDCGRCMSFWAPLVWAACSGEFTLPTFAFSALLSCLSGAMGQLLTLVSEGLRRLLGELISRWC